MNIAKLLVPVATLATVALLSTAATAQEEEYDPIKAFPDEQHDEVSRWLWTAREIAGQDLYPAFAQRCILDQVYPVLDDLMQKPGYVAPTKAFDDLFFVGTTRVSSWALDTGDGIVLFDALITPEQAETIIIPGLEAMGYSGEDISHVVINHEHRDHYGGAAWLQENFGAEIVASDLAWTAMAEQEGTPSRDLVVADGQTLTIGDKTLSFYITPGHTDGALSIIIPVTDQGTPHVAAMFGGFGIPRSADGKETQIASLERWRGIAGDAKVDVLIGNHQVQDFSLYHFDLLRHRREGDLNPFVLKADDGYDRFLQVQAACVRVKAARDGQTLTQ
ncbi:MBL fold metallo-hydrolase [Salipiger thiooxidans]|uniref:MBL fold metallo-hydrolase n=1 Tax=Salipiger thiooxidans TaxID=282683 RepID=UPI001CD27207|nr:MBL fold metallo-hydrolase [Salipiger thiooxidans]MCA0851391.1 MBL fold metallo-hydrolase [Salipiger thiooxidans]